MDWNDVLYEGIAWRVLYRGIAWRGSWRVNHETSYLMNPAGASTRPRRGKLAKSVRCRGASTRLVDQPWRLMSIRIWQWALWVLIGEFWYHGPPGAIAPKIDPADADEAAGASVLNVAVGGVHGPVVEMASTAASADRGAGSDTATDDDDGEDDAASADSDFFAAVQMSSAAEVARRAVVHREVVHRIEHPSSDSSGGRGRGDCRPSHHPGASNPSSMIDDRLHRHKPVRASLAKVAPRRSRASSSVPPTGYTYYTAGSATYIQNPAGAHSAVGASTGVSALNPHGAPAGYYYKAGADCLP